MQQTCVLPLVRFQFGLCEEALATVRTKQLEVPSVATHVRQKVSTVAKLLFTLKV